jgi:hypothetical protein
MRDISTIVMQVSLLYIPYRPPQKEPRAMTISTHLSPLLAIIVGILILIAPRFLNYFVAIYLIVTGLLGLGVLR